MEIHNPGPSTPSDVRSILTGSKSAGPTSSEACAAVVDNRLFYKYVGLFVAVVCLALLANGVFEIYFYYREHKTALIHLQREQAEAAAAKLSQFIKEIENQLGWITQLPASAGSIEQRGFDAMRLLRQVPAITELSQIDASGKERLRMSRLAMAVVDSGIDFSQEPKFTEAVANRVYYGPVYFRRESEPYMTLAIAGTRRDSGVSVVEVNLKMIWDVVKQINVGQRGLAYVVDAQGRLIAHPDIHLVLRNTDMSGLIQVKEAREGAASWAEKLQQVESIQRQMVLSASARVDPLGWLVFVELPVAEANAPLYAAFQRLAWVLLAALLFAVFAGMLLARRMIGPIRALRLGAGRIASGDLSQHIVIKSGDELEALADQFNHMTARLRESYAHLDRKVEVRTREVSEALEQQTATSDVLKVISSSQGELQPVFNVMLENACRICNAKFGDLLLYDGEHFYAAGHQNAPPAYKAMWADGPRAPSPGSGLDRIVRTKQVVHVADVIQEAEFAMARPCGVRTCLLVPILKEHEILAVIGMYRQEMQPFTDKQIELVQNFAAQAVIAIDNARLLKELHQRTGELVSSVEELQALGEVSQAVNSTLDLETVLSSIVVKAVQLSGTDAGTIYVSEPKTNAFEMRATYGMSQEVVSELSWQGISLGETTIGEAAERRAPVQIADLDQVTVSPARRILLRAGYRALLVVPLIGLKAIAGVLVVRRRAPGEFSEHTVNLLQTFAVQSVLAIQNANLFAEVEEKSRQLELANLAKSRFIAAASHDLRQPLHALNLFVSQLRDRMSSAERIRLVARIESAITAMNELFNALLDLSKADAGLVTVDSAEFSIARLLKRVEETFVGATREKGLELRIVPSAAWVRSDFILLERILFNLVSNAVQYTARGGILIGCRKRGDALRIEVWDSGVGIPEDQLRNIFGEFYRLAGRAQDRGSGLGLGLAIVDRLAQLLDHQVEVTSRIGVGSRFSVTVPLAVAHPDGLVSSVSPPEIIDPARGKLVVVIDDDVLVLEGMHVALKGWGCNVVTAASGTAALVALAEHKRSPDLIISDCRLSGGETGFAVIERLRHVFDSAIPAFLISGDTAPEPLREASVSGYYLLHKPVLPITLRAIVNQLLKDREVVSDHREAAFADESAICQPPSGTPNPALQLR
jgi:signal transduction histidine kinase/DNA-binding NarL/FixJ family response regulator